MFYLAVGIIIISLCSCNAFIPPVGSHFQIKSTITNKCLFNNNVAGFGIYECGAYDQWWTLTEKSADGKSYRIKNTNTGKCLFYNNAAGLDIYECVNNYDDQLWTISNDENGEGNKHRITNTATTKCLFSNHDTLNVYECKPDFLDQVWEFILEPAEITKVEFKPLTGNFHADAPILVGTGTCDNTGGSTEAQEIEVTISETITETSKFEHTAGMGLEIGATFKTGVPFVAQGEISTTVSFDYEHTWGEENSFEETFGGVYKVACGVGQKIIMTCHLYQGTLSVPYTMTLKTIGTKKSFTTDGIWHGTQSFGLTCDYTKPTK